MRLDGVYFIQKEKFQAMIQTAEQEHLLQQAKLHKPGQTSLQHADCTHSLRSKVIASILSIGIYLLSLKGAKK